MSRHRKILVVSVLMIAVGVLSLGHARSYVMRTGVCESCKTIITLTWPPADYFDSIAEDVVLSRDDSVLTARFSFVPTYHGRYAIVLFGSSVRLYERNGQYSLKCEGMRSPKVVAGELVSRWAKGGVSGFGLIWFSTPDEIALGDRAACEVHFYSLQIADPTISVHKLADI